MHCNKLGVFLGAVSLLVPMAVRAAERPTTFMQRIVVRGNDQVSAPKILRVLALKPGEGYDPERIRPALKRLYETRQFRDVRAYKEDGTAPDSVVVVIEVAEFPRVDEVRFEGVDHVGEDDLRKVVGITKGTFARPSLLNKDREAIEGVYHEKGYSAVAVRDTVVRDEKTKSRVLVYRIAEGEKVRIKHIDFIGAQGIDTEMIDKVVKSEPDTWLSGGDYNPKELEADRERIIELYKTQGYLDVAVNEPEFVFSPDHRDVDVFITISEGTRYFVGKIDW